VSFSGATGSVLISLQVERSAAEGATGLEADHGIATYRFAQSLTPEADSADVGTVETPSMADVAADEIPLAA
jgi:hypothetical protein